MHWTEKSDKILKNKYGESMKSILLKICVIILALVLILSTIFFYFTMTDWTVRFDSELDEFFGEGNWFCVDSETKDSIIYSKTYTSRNVIGSETVAGKFTDWYIKHTDADGNDNLYRITDHVMRINHDKYFVLQNEYLSAKQAFVLELMDITHQIAADEIWENTISTELGTELAECIGVEIMYDGGNPEPDFYDELWEEPWFTIDGATAENYLETDLYDFYINIRVYDYRAKKLSHDQYEALMNGYTEIIQAMCERFDENADFEIYFSPQQKAKYIGGKLQ